MKKEILEKTIELRRRLHMCPELSGQETETLRELKTFLEKNTKLEVTDMDGWLYSYYRSGNPDGVPIAFRADMDALPVPDGADHRCGHDGHSAVLAGLACQIEAAAEAGKHLNRDVYFIFQPAEETGAGGEKCAELITDKNISEVYAFHNWSGYPEGSVVLREGTFMCASKGLSIRCKGRAAHASKPEDGINPAMTLAEIMRKAMEAAREDEYQGDVLLTVVGLNIGGENFGIAPGEGTLSLTIRAEKEKDMLLLHEKIEGEARDLAKAGSLEIEIRQCDVFPETCNDAGLCAKVEKVAEKLKLKRITLDKPIRSSEDFGWYQKKCSGVMFFIGNGTDYPQVHTEKYEFNDNIIETAVDMFCELAAM